MTNGMRLVVPRHLLTWIDENRGSRSREAFVVKMLFTIKDTTGNIDETIHESQLRSGSSKGIGS